MTFRMHVMISVVLLCVAGLLLGCSSDDSATPAAIDEAPPAAIAGLNVQILSNGNVELIWSAATEPNVSGYNVYRQAVSGQAFTRLNNSLVTDNRYVDTDTARNHTYQYRVTAVSSGGLESAHSAISANTATDRGKSKNFQRL
jgi:fibronectin type 3 domain-containing protein